MIVALSSGENLVDETVGRSRDSNGVVVERETEDLLTAWLNRSGCA